MEGLEDAQTTLPPSPPSETIRHDPLASTALPTSTLPPSKTADEELQSKILRQVEFYFSDANLPTDDFLRNIICRPGTGGGNSEKQEGWVPIKTLASFHKMKKLTKNIPTIVAALQTSTELEVSPEGQRVRRTRPFDFNIDFDDIRSRTVITWNLPEKPTIDYVINLFSSIGELEMARIRKSDHPEPLLTRGLKTEFKKSARDFYALLEYKTREDAVKAVEKLHDESNWRSGLRVKLLVPVPKETSRSNGGGGGGGGGVAAAGGGGGVKKKKAPATEARDIAVGEEVASEETPSQVMQRPKPAWARSVQNLGKELQKSEDPSLGANCEGFIGNGDGCSNKSTDSNNVDTVLSTTSNKGSVGVKLGQPRMPDAVDRGFGFGRGSIPSEDSLSRLLISSFGGKSDAAAPGSVVDGTGEGT